MSRTPQTLSAVKNALLGTIYELAQTNATTSLYGGLGVIVMVYGCCGGSPPDTPRPITHPKTDPLRRGGSRQELPAQTRPQPKPDRKWDPQCNQARPTKPDQAAKATN